MSTWANKINYFPKWTYQFWFLFGVSDVRYQSGVDFLDLIVRDAMINR